MSELMLDPRQEILDIIDKESNRYTHVEQYAKFDDNGCVTGCCINGLVMMHFGWKPKSTDMAIGTPLPQTWQDMAILMNKRYGENTIGDINTVNSHCKSWEECKEQLRDYWKLP